MKKMKGYHAGAKTGKAEEDSVVEIGKEMGIFKKDGGPVAYSTLTVSHNVATSAWQEQSPATTCSLNKHRKAEPPSHLSPRHRHSLSSRRRMDTSMTLTQRTL